jgi:DHA2 family metal-tetracycline-proton antiporter-like MFS transporter
MNTKAMMPLWTAGLFLVIMNTTMFNVSLPDIIADIEVSAEAGSWIIAGYSVGFAFSTLIYSRLSDYVPIRRLLVIGLVTIGSASIFGAFTWDYYSLLAARILQSAGAGSMTGLGMIVIRRYIPSDQRGKAIALISAGSTLAFGLGPIVGGGISALLGWNGLFVVTCLVLIPMVPLIRLLPSEQARPFRLDLLGALLTIINITSLLVVFTQHSLYMLCICIGSFIIHAVHLRKEKQPFIPIEHFRIPNYGKLVTIGFFLVFGNLANLFLMPIVLADFFQMTSMDIGLILAPGALLAALSSRYIGRWIDQKGNMMFLLTGHLIVAMVLCVFAVSLPISAAVILVGYVIMAPVNISMLASLNNETLQVLPDHATGSGMGLLQLIQYIGSSFAVALSGLMISLQEQLPAEIAYQNIYLGLAISMLVSFGLALWHQIETKRTSPK